MLWFTVLIALFLHFVLLKSCCASQSTVWLRGVNDHAGTLGGTSGDIGVLHEHSTVEGLQIVSFPNVAFAAGEKAVTPSSDPQSSSAGPYQRRRRPNIAIAPRSSWSRPQQEDRDDSSGSVSANWNFQFTFTNLNAFFTDPNNKDLVIHGLATILERIYEIWAFAMLDFESLERHDLEIRVGSFVLRFYCVAEYLSMLAVKAVTRRLGQLVQEGLTGVMAGEVLDVQTAVKTVFAFELVVKIYGY